jgi:hypothetical protein
MDRSHWCSAKHREWYSSACTGASHSPHYVQVQYLYSTVTAQRLTRGVPAHTHCCTLIPTITAPSPSRITPPFVVSYPTAPAFPFQGASFLWPAVRPGPVQYLQSADQAAPTPSAISGGFGLLSGLGEASGDTPFDPVDPVDPGSPSPFIIAKLLLLELVNIPRSAPGRFASAGALNVNGRGSGNW